MHACSMTCAASGSVSLTILPSTSPPGWEGGIKSGFTPGFAGCKQSHPAGNAQTTYAQPFSCLTPPTASTGWFVPKPQSSYYPKCPGTGPRAPRRSLASSDAHSLAPSLGTLALCGPPDVIDSKGICPPGPLGAPRFSSLSDLMHPCHPVASIEAWGLLLDASQGEPCPKIPSQQRWIS